MPTRLALRATVAAMVLTVLALVPSPSKAAGPGTMIIVGNAGLFLCPPGSGDVVIEGVNDIGNHWTFTFEYANSSEFGCLSAGAGAAAGNWNPASGGAVSGLGLGQLSISAVPSALTPTPVSIQVCLPAPCYAGGGVAFRA